MFYFIPTIHTHVYLYTPVKRLNYFIKLIKISGLGLGWCVFLGALSQCSCVDRGAFIHRFPQPLVYSFPLPIQHTASITGACILTR